LNGTLNGRTARPRRRTGIIDEAQPRAQTKTEREAGNEALGVFAARFPFRSVVLGSPVAVLISSFFVFVLRTCRNYDARA